MYKQSSKSSFYGRFTNKKKEKELIISYKDSTITIVERKIYIYEPVLVFRAILHQCTQTFSTGECIEKSSFSDCQKYVYKNVKGSLQNKKKLLASIL